MKRSAHGVIAATGMLALAGGLAAATALPAAAAPVPNQAYAAAASGLINQSPIAEATSPGSSPVTLPYSHIFELLTTGPINDQAGPTSASSAVTHVVATLLGRTDLTAAGLASFCSSSPVLGAAAHAGPRAADAVATGRTYILTGKIAGPSGPIILPFAPAPNTHYAVPGGYTVTLNKQTTLDGTLTVDAIYATLRGGAEHLAVGVSVCKSADVTPTPTPTPTPTS
jgi:hypothetical protein